MSLPRMTLVRKALIFAFGLAVLLGGHSVVNAGDSLTELRDAVGRPRFQEIRRFGNKKKLGKRVDPRLDRTDGRRFYERGAASGRSQIVALRRFGNKKRISKLVDPSSSNIPGGSLVYRADPQGRGNFVTVKRFGNKKRIRKIAGKR